MLMGFILNKNSGVFKALNKRWAVNVKDIDVTDEKGM